MNTKQRIITLFLAIGLYALPSLAGGVEPNPMFAAQPAPAPKFLNRRKILAIGVSAAMLAVDVAATEHALDLPGTREMNPLAQSAGALVILKIAGFGAGLGFSYMLHRTGHYKAERIVPMIFGIPSVAAGIHNAGIHH